MYTYVLVNRLFTNGQYMCLPLLASIEKTVLAMKILWLSGKGKVSGAALSKRKIMLRVIWDMKSSMITEFLEKGASENNDSYYQILGHIHTEIMFNSLSENVRIINI